MMVYEFKIKELSTKSAERMKSVAGSYLRAVESCEKATEAAHNSTLSRVQVTTEFLSLLPLLQL